MAARSSTRGGGGAPSSLTSTPGSVGLPRAARRALRRHRGRAGALPRGHFDHAATPFGSSTPSCPGLRVGTW